MVIQAQFKRNPVQEWMRQFNHETEQYQDLIIRNIVNDYIHKADQAMKGVLTSEDLQSLPKSTIDTLEINEDYKNTKGEYDFFRYLNVFKGLSSQFPPEVQDYLNNSKLWQFLPFDYYEAQNEYDLTNISRILDNFASRLNGNGFMKYIELFAASDKPGVISADKIPQDTPNEFKNEAGVLDFYFIVKVIAANQEKFGEFYQEIKEGILMYNDLPDSVDKAKINPGHIDYLASLLWALYGSFGSQCLPKLLAREDYFNSLLQLTFAVPSAKLITLGTRILRHVIPTQHSPQTLRPYWESISDMIGYRADIVSYLFEKIGKGMIWYENEKLKEISLR